MIKKLLFQLLCLLPGVAFSATPVAVINSDGEVVRSGYPRSATELIRSGVFEPALLAQLPTVDYTDLSAGETIVSNAPVNLTSVSLASPECSVYTNGSFVLTNRVNTISKDADTVALELAYQGYVADFNSSFGSSVTNVPFVGARLTFSQIVVQEMAANSPGRLNAAKREAHIDLETIERALLIDYATKYKAGNWFLTAQGPDKFAK